MLVHKLFYSTPHQHRLDVQPAGKELFFKTQVILKRGSSCRTGHTQPATLPRSSHEEEGSVLQHLLCHKVLIRDRRLMPTQIGSIPVPCSEWWPGRMKSISLQKPGTLLVRYWIPVLRVAVAFQQCTGNWPALHTLNCTQGRERRGWVVCSLIFIMHCSCIMLSLCNEHCWGITLVFPCHIIPGDFFLYVVTHLEKAWPARCDSLVYFGYSAKKLSSTAYWRDTLFYWKSIVFCN